jgi:hypothetical protein
MALLASALYQLWPRIQQLVQRDPRFGVRYQLNANDVVLFVSPRQNAAQILFDLLHYFVRDLDLGSLYFWYLLFVRRNKRNAVGHAGFSLNAKSENFTPRRKKKSHTVRIALRVSDSKKQKGRSLRFPILLPIHQKRKRRFHA